MSIKELQQKIDAQQEVINTLEKQNLELARTLGLMLDWQHGTGEHHMLCEDRNLSGEEAQAKSEYEGELWWKANDLLNTITKERYIQSGHEESEVGI